MLCALLCALRCFALLCFVLFCFILLRFALFYFILLCFALLYFDLTFYSLFSPFLGFLFLFFLLLFSAFYFVSSLFLFSPYGRILSVRSLSTFPPSSSSHPFFALSLFSRRENPSDSPFVFSPYFALWKQSGSLLP